MTLDAAMQDLIANFPLGFVASVTADGAPAVSPKGTFLVLDSTTIAFADIRSPGTRRNLAANPRVEVNFIDPFARKAVRLSGQANIHREEGDWFAKMHPRWIEVFGGLANRASALIEIRIKTASMIWTPPYDDGTTEDTMIAYYKTRFAKVYP
ncbi:pyridoxamine 5'-phosphate oxidase family protein [Yoonia sp.]|uniref:pyridoxamine 5'-phosphate oxidase family protein n=1 Tax=Yoonia sp. TaxID=2212373 RepID=UPI00391CBE8A